MSTRLAHRAELFAMNLAIRAMDQTSRSSLLTRSFQRFYRVVQNGSLLIWGGAILASSIAGYLIGYLAYILVPR